MDHFAGIFRLMQTRLESFIESCMNILIGYGVALISQLLIFPLYGIHVPLASNIMIGIWFTIISLTRSYAIRRFYNRRHRSAAHGQ